MWVNNNRSLHALCNRARSFAPNQAASDAAHAAEAAAAAARRAADTLAREEDSHTVAHQLKQYRRAQMAKASAAMQQSPAPAPLPPQTADPVPSPEKIAAAVQRLRSLRQPSRPVDPSRAFGGGVWLP
jgi:hypothetical protein